MEVLILNFIFKVVYLCTDISMKFPVAVEIVKNAAEEFTTTMEHFIEHAATKQKDEKVRQLYLWRIQGNINVL